MALVVIGTTKDYADRPVEISKDTDDLDDKTYGYYFDAKKIGRDDLALKILKEDLTAEEIEADKRFNCLTDTFCYTMAKLTVQNQKG